MEEADGRVAEECEHDPLVDEQQERVVEVEVEHEDQERLVAQIQEVVQVVVAVLEELVEEQHRHLLRELERHLPRAVRAVGEAVVARPRHQQDHVVVRRREQVDLEVVAPVAAAVAPSDRPAARAGRGRRSPRRPASGSGGRRRQRSPEAAAATAPTRAVSEWPSGREVGLPRHGRAGRRRRGGPPRPRHCSLLRPEARPSRPLGPSPSRAGPATLGAPPSPAKGVARHRTSTGALAPEGHWS